MEAGPRSRFGLAYKPCFYEIPRWMWPLGSLTVLDPNAGRIILNYRNSNFLFALVLGLPLTMMLTALHFNAGDTAGLPPIQTVGLKSAFGYVPERISIYNNSASARCMLCSNPETERIYAVVPCTLHVIKGLTSTSGDELCLCLHVKTLEPLIAPLRLYKRGARQWPLIAFLASITPKSHSKCVLQPNHEYYHHSGPRSKNRFGRP